jgi:hypothetical protein
MRSEKIAMIQRYGSPNVFSQFQPHVTLLCDAKDPDEKIQQAFNSLVVRVRHFTASILGLGVVGPHGTVMRGQDMGDYTFGKN